jgi:Protein of unknown function (DUF2891)
VLCERIEEQSRSYYAKDQDIPAKWEPDGADFFSPSLMEVNMMRRVLHHDSDFDCGTSLG